MKVTKGEEFLVGVYVFLVIFMVFFPIVLLVSGCGDSATVERSTTEDFGRECYEAGISAEANPFQGGDYSASKQWLRGWIEAKKESEGTK